jgi:hypothetical protein
VEDIHSVHVPFRSGCIVAWVMYIIYRPMNLKLGTRSSRKNETAEIKCLRVCGHSLSLSLSLSCYFHSEHRASVKRVVSLQFLNRETVSTTPRTGISLSQGRYLHKHRINANRHPYFVGFEPTIPAFKRAKTVHSLDRAATVIRATDLV